MKKIFVILSLLISMFSSLHAMTPDEQNTTMQSKSQEVVVDGLKFGMSLDEFISAKIPEDQDRITYKKNPQKVNYISEFFFRNMGIDTDWKYYEYRTKIADLDALVWVYFTEKTSELFAVKVEWKDPAVNLNRLDKDIEEILTQKYGKSSHTIYGPTWKVDGVKIMHVMKRVNIDDMYFRNFVAVTYVDIELEKENQENTVPEKRSGEGL